MGECPYQKQWNGRYTDIFCINCWTHETHFKGGQSWSPDLCPCGCEDTTIWYKMNSRQKKLARGMFVINERSKN